MIPSHPTDLYFSSDSAAPKRHGVSTEAALISRYWANSIVEDIRSKKAMRNFGYGNPLGFFESHVAKMVALFLLVSRSSETFAQELTAVTDMHISEWEPDAGPPPRILTVLTTHKERSGAVKAYRDATKKRSDGYKPLVSRLGTSRPRTTTVVTTWRSSLMPRALVMVVVTSTRVCLHGVVQVDHAPEVRRSVKITPISIVSIVTFGLTATFPSHVVRDIVALKSFGAHQHVYLSHATCKTQLFVVSDEEDKDEAGVVDFKYAKPQQQRMLAAITEVRLEDVHEAKSARVGHGGGGRGVNTQKEMWFSSSKLGTLTMFVFHVYVLCPVTFGTFLSGWTLVVKET